MPTSRVKFSGISILLTIDLSLRIFRSNWSGDKPSIEWIAERINQLEVLLDQNTSQSTLVLRDVLGSIKLEATYAEIGRPYYIARSSINTLANFGPSTNPEYLDNVSPVLRWWARKERIRTFAEIPFQINVAIATTHYVDDATVSRRSNGSKSYIFEKVIGRTPG